MYKGYENAYTAGLIDGEAYIGIIKHKNRSGNISYSVTFELSSTNREVMEWLLDKYGGIINPVKRGDARSGNYKPQWRWLLRRRRGLRYFLFYMSRYCIIKRAQIELAREFMAGNLDGESAWLKMKGLNRRGKALPEV